MKRITYELATYVCVSESQPYPGQHPKKCAEQGEGEDSALCFHESRGVVHPECCTQVWSLQQEKDVSLLEPEVPRWATANQRAGATLLRLKA